MRKSIALLFLFLSSTAVDAGFLSNLLGGNISSTGLGIPSIGGGKFGGGNASNTTAASGFFSNLLGGKMNSTGLGIPSFVGDKLGGGKSSNTTTASNSTRMSMKDLLNLGKTSAQTALNQGINKTENVLGITAANSSSSEGPLVSVATTLFGQRGSTNDTTASGTSQSFSWMNLRGSVSTALDNENRCYSSTKALMDAQVKDWMAQVALGKFEHTVYQVCANTKIMVGPPATLQYSTFVPDMPLTLVRPNCTIQCGDNGARTNNCILQSARAMTLFRAQTTFEQYNLYNLDISDITIKGFTFTGTLNVANAFPNIPAAVVGISAPGTNVVFDDCQFSDLTADDIFFVGRNAFTTIDQLPYDSTSVTIQHSYFKNIKYAKSVMYADSQSLAVTDSVFDNVKFGGNFTSVVSGNFFYCYVGPQCIFQNSCFNNVNFAQSMFLGLDLDETSNLSLLKIQNVSGTDITVASLNQTAMIKQCRAGLATGYLQPNITVTSCVDPFDMDTCPSTAGDHSSCINPRYRWLQC
jgi:hypothetical protein